MSRSCVFAALALLFAAPMWAQEVPTDASGLLAWHLAHEGAPETATDAAWRAYVYVQAGAEGEVRAAATQLETLSPGDPDADRFRLEADCWSPATREQGLRRADAWLTAHAEADAGSVARVQTLRDFLAAETDRAAISRSADVAAGWLPFLALAAFALMTFGAWRLLLRE